MKPEQWVRATLRDVVLHLGRGTSPTYVSDASTVFAVNQKCVRHGRATPEHARPHAPSAPVKPDSILRPGDLCINSTGTGTIGRVGLWEGREAGTFFADTHVTVVRPNTAQIVPRFLSESLLSPWVQREMEVSCFTGSTNQIELSKSAFSGLALLLPPLGEQKKIAAILASVDEAIDAAQAVIDQVQLVKKAMMAELLTRGLPGKHTRFKQTEIGELPEAWGIAPLETLTIVITKGSSPGWQGFEYQEEGVLFVTSENVRDGLLDLEEPKYIPFDFAAKIAKSGLIPGDVLVNIVGASIGRAALWRGEFPKANVNQAVAVIRPDPKKLIPRLVLDTLYSPRGQAYFGTSKVDNARPNVSLTNLRDFLMIVPGLDEQRTICSIADAWDGRLLAESECLAHLRTMKGALMAALLTGEVRVRPGEEAA